MNRTALPFAAFLRIALLLAMAALAAAPAARAQIVEPVTVSPIVAEQQQVIMDLVERAEGLERRVDAAAEDDARLVELRLELEGLERQLLQAGVAFRPRLQEINTRLELLGPAPAEGQPAEADIIANERRALQGEKSQINILIGDAEATSLKVNRTIARIAELRRDLFANTLSKQYEIDYELFGQVVEELQSEAGDLVRTIGAWLRFVVNYKMPQVLAATFFAIAAAAVILIGGRRLVGRLIERDPTAEDPPYISRLSVTFWSTLLVSGALAVFLGLVWFFFDYFEVLRGDIGAMLVALFTVIALAQFVHRLAKAVLSPDMPNWRLVEIEPKPARLLVWLATATAVAVSLDYLLTAVFEIMGSPLSLTVGESLAATTIVGILVILIGRVRPFLHEDGRPRPWPVLLRVLFYGLGGVTVAAALLGYIGFAKFMSQQIVVTGAILATMYIGLLSARALSEEGAFAGTAFGRMLGRRFDFDESTFDQIGLAASVLVNLLVVVVGVPLILLQWGFHWGDIRSYAYSLANEIRIGTVSFSLVGIFSGLLVFAIGYFATRWFQSWIDGSVMARGRVDAGVRNSIRTAVGYAGVALAGLIGVSAAGIDLSSLALVAGALSLGIGFGLQNVVSNFVSGLILLAERPFKVGDWIVAGAVSGTVRKISVRATEIETFQRQTMILPNSELINAAVGNWTHKNKLGRVDIKVGVAYGTDARSAHALLLAIARNHPLVLKNPEPFVLLANFGPAAMEFEIRVFLADVLNGSVVQNDIRFAILEQFDEAGIDIPSTPRAMPTLPLVRMVGEVQADQEGPAAVPTKPRRGRKPDPG